jgi:hypothetical protein
MASTDTNTARKKGNQKPDPASLARPPIPSASGSRSNSSSRPKTPAREERSISATSLRNKSPIPPSSGASQPSNRKQGTRESSKTRNVSTLGNTPTKTKQMKAVPSQPGSTKNLSQQGVGDSGNDSANKGDYPEDEADDSNIPDIVATVNDIKNDVRARVSIRWSKAPLMQHRISFTIPCIPTPDPWPKPSEVTTASSIIESPRDIAEATLSSTGLVLQYIAGKDSCKSGTVNIATAHIMHVSRVLDSTRESKSVFIYYKTDAGSFKSPYIAFKSEDEANKWFFGLTYEAEQERQ